MWRMFYTDLLCKSEPDFKRLTGVGRLTFEQMLDAYTQTKRDFGRPPKLGYADQVLLALIYRRQWLRHCAGLAREPDPVPHGETAPGGFPGRADLPDQRVVHLQDRPRGRESTHRRQPLPSAGQEVPAVPLRPQEGPHGCHGSADPAPK